jgi:hypothetical protein
VFGTVVDGRSGVACEAEKILKPLGYSLDWLPSRMRGVPSTSPAWTRHGRAAFVKLARGELLLGAVAAKLVPATPIFLRLSLPSHASGKGEGERVIAGKSPAATAQPWSDRNLL